MMTLDLMWWLGWLYFAAWALLPLALIGIAGPVVGVLMWAALAPWSALLGMSAAHRLLPAAEEGTFRMFADRGSVRWALKGWAPSVYLGVFQPVFFLSTGFQRVALRAFGARLAPGAHVTTRTSIREPHLLELGRDSFIGEYAHLVCSYQPRPRVLVVARIKIGDGVLIGAYSVLGGGCRVGSRSIVEYRVSLGAHSSIGEDTRIGAGTSIRNRARVGNGVRIGKLCQIGLGAVVPDGARLPDGTVWPAVAAASGGGGGA
jgi:carbonic anhydrase/acetyltransferase-like protein (isoleucine patch superfamily)